MSVESMIPLSKGGTHICECSSVCHMWAIYFQRGFDALFSSRENWYGCLCSVGMVVVVTFPWVCVLASVADILAPLLGVALGTGACLRIQHCRMDILASHLAFQSLCFVCLSSGPARSLVSLPLHTSFFSPTLRLLLLFFPCSCFFFSNWPILGTVFYPLLLEVVLKKPCPFLFFLYCLKAIKNWMCVLLLRTRIWRVCLKAELNTMSLICMHRKKRREQITCVTFSLWRVSKITQIPWGTCFPQGIFRGHSWEMAGNKWSETEIKLRGFAWDFLWSSATSHTATFLSWGCCPLTVRGNYEMKICKG